MLPEIYSILSAYFLFGALGILLINRRDQGPAQKKERWVKYIVYLILVNAVIFIIHSGYFLYLSLILVLLGLYEMISVGKTNIKRLIFSVFIYSFFAVFFVLSSKNEPEFLLTVYLLILTFDGFSQIIGQLFGKNKLAPSTSPNKTNEGFLGGMLSVMLTLFILFPSFDLTSILFFILGGMLFSLAALGGDLLASYYKRMNKVKDFSKLIPGHGGVLDRFDSFIFTLGIITFFALTIYGTT
ncbi:MAG: putative phosphatidate cytidylyltransferase [Crocinitomicaceae bacterium]|jgi:phosphatidate cytidylyltransferase|nr:putative phosphatidate cytidylyltransferase [Crocinitomicaceae bacterium]